MSEATLTTPPRESSATAPNWKERFDRVEQWLTKASDRLNPILVKETRQALKSRQFGLTFLLLLIICWVVTIGGVAMAGPGIYYAAAGAELLKGYFFVLIFPLAVIVPFSAYRSLTSECEENTYDLLRVSTLSPHQIIRGKLGSALVQTTVYLSAVAPCIAFTYLLRGVDVVVIAMLLMYTVLGSLGLSMLGLFMAAISQKKQGQVLLSVSLVTLLLLCFWGGLAMVNEVLDDGGLWVNDWQFWASTGMLLSAYATTFALIYLATVALTSYRSENRSTPLRWAMVIQQATFLGWMSFLWLATDTLWWFLLPTVLVATAYWYVMGTMLSTESAELSHRVRRGLPQSMLGRVLLGLLNPGPGTGYLFAIANLTSVMVVVAIGLAWMEWGQTPLAPSSQFQHQYHYHDYTMLMVIMAIAWSFVVIYLGVGKLLTAGLRRVAPVSGVAGFLVHLLLVMAGSGIPYAVQMSSRMWRNAGYTILQWPNPFWTLGELSDRMTIDDTVILQCLVMLTGAACVLLINLPSTAREMMQERVSLPDRVAQDEAELHPPVSKPQSPWDEDQEDNAPLPEIT
ncbi:ABC transporter permease [Aeoliella sp. SH292]|uniref:ABC transporter permease n=1 Tax=Aeoliella sp. SH292 TaxID=3454464 RepID=UPI003F9B58B2